MSPFVAVLMGSPTFVPASYSPVGGTYNGGTQMGTNSYTITASRAVTWTVNPSTIYGGYIISADNKTLTMTVNSDTTASRSCVYTVTANDGKTTTNWSITLTASKVVG